MNILRRTLAVLIFAAIAYLPWHYWQTAGHVMNGELPKGTMGMDAHSAASAWWLMGMSVVVWLPLSLVVAWVVARVFLSLTEIRQTVDLAELARKNAAIKMRARQSAKPEGRDRADSSTDESDRRPG
jgi:hypothetical protein